MIGTLLGDYELKQKLGEGGTGETYLAAHKGSGQQAAVKVLFPSLCSDAAQLDRFFAEVRVASTVNHVGIADLYHSGIGSDGRAFLVMELLDGKTLTDSLIELGAVSEIGSLADIGWQLATLLAAVHAAGLRHGSLKPDAVYLTFPANQAPRPLVRLLDFGMSQFSLSVRHGQTGSLLGAPLYMAPEIARGAGYVDHRADIYSLGCILFEMACGRPPFVREGKGELVLAHTSEVPPPVSSLVPSIPPPIDALVVRMLTKNPAARPQSMHEVASVLEKLLACPVPGSSLFASSSSSLQPPASHGPVLAATVAIPGGSPPEASSAALRRSDQDVSQASVPSSGHYQDATALLPPSSTGMPTAVMPGPNQSWIDRVKQRTAMLAQPSAAGWAVPPAEIPAEHSRALASRAPRRCSRPHRPPRRKPPLSAYFSVPVVLATASAVLVVGAAILLVRSRRAPPPPPPRAPLHATASTEQVKSPSAAFSFPPPTEAQELAPDAAPPEDVQPPVSGAKQRGPSPKRTTEPRVVKPW